MELSYEQKLILESQDPRIVVSASSGSGKTRTLIEVVRKELRRPDCDPKKIVLITFTNNSANEMKSRLGKDYTEEMYIGTIHGYANLLLTESGISTAAIRRDEDFDQLFNEVMYNPKCIRPVDFLALDEAQDSSALHYEFILDMVRPEQWIFFGDERQSIYGFNNASPESFRSLTMQEDVMTYYLNENYRCGKRIVELGNRLAVNAVKRPLPPASPARDDFGKVIELKSSSDIVTQISKNNDFRGTAVLCRTNRKVGEIIHQLTRKGIPTITYKQGDNTIEELEAKNRMDAVKVLTIHSAKGLEFDNVFLIELEDKSRESWRLMYVAATRAKNNLYFWADGRRPAYEVAKMLREAAKRSK